MPVLLQYGLRGPDIPLEEILSGARLDEVLLVVPTRRRIRHLSRELLTLAGAGVAPALPIHTLASLALSVYRSSPAPRRLIAGPAQTLLFDGAVRQSRESLGYFRVKAREQRLYQGTFDRVIDVILHLKESGVTPDLLEEEAAGAPADEQAKLRDVALLYRAYDERLAASRAVDDAGVMAFLHAGCTQEEFRTMFRTVYPALRQLSLAGFDEFTAPELGFIRKLCGLQDLSVSLLFDFQHRNRPLFGHLEDNYARFLEMGFREERLPRADRRRVGHDGVPSTEHEGTGKADEESRECGEGESARDDAVGPRGGHEVGGGRLPRLEGRRERGRTASASEEEERAWVSISLLWTGRATRWGTPRIH